MSENSPRPWSLFVHEEQEGGDGEISIVAGGEWIASMNLRRSTAKADAALIVAAVNAFAMTADQKQIKEECDRKVAAVMALLEDDSKSERDRLRDLVRRLAATLDDASDALWLAGFTQSNPPPNPPHRYLHGVDIDALIREAREALGEAEP